MATQMSIRRPQLAGSWYPASATDCDRMLADFADETVRAAFSNPVAGVVPHAGWVFSGSVAYNVVRELARGAGQVDTVVLFAGHLHPTSELTVMTVGDCWTPYGNLPTDEALAQAVLDRHAVAQETATRHRQDNSTEVELPLIKRCFPDASIVIVGAAPRSEVVELADAVVDAAQSLGRSIVALGSTDLTHYGPNYGWLPHGIGSDAEEWVRTVNDPLFLDAACSSDPHTALAVANEHRNACCPGAVAATMQCAARLGAGHTQRLRYATSADIHRDASFVGYGGLIYG